MALTQEMVQTLPRATGIYIIKDEDGISIYVGKALDIRSRVRAYLGQDVRAYVTHIREHAKHIDFMLTSNEKEALLLENQLIKTYKPKYNIVLKDDKTYVSIKITTNQEWPSIFITRRIQKDGSLYFGPYSSAQATKNTLAAIGKIFPIRRCKDVEFRNRIRPCIYYQIGLCAAPCVKKIAKDEYAQMVMDLVSFLEGTDKALIADLEARMRKQAGAFNFEAAAKIRDQINAIAHTLTPQNIVASSAGDLDVFGIDTYRNRTKIAVLHISSGAIVDGQSFVVKNNGLKDEEVLGKSIFQFYLGRVVPKVIYVNTIPEDKEILEAVLSDIRDLQVKIVQAKRGRPKQWVLMAQKNASTHAKENGESALEEIVRVFHLPRIPHRMECFDISSIQGMYAVGSMVVFVDGFPEKDQYRRYKIKDSSFQDDFSMMKEVFSRRLKGDEQPPDLIVLDGGKGQLGICEKVFKDLNITSVPIVAIAKEKGDKKDRFFLPGRKNPLFLSPRSNALKLLIQLRDEAHRFAIIYHKQLRSKSFKRSVLEDIPGIGRKKASRILMHIGQIGNIHDIDVEGLKECKGLTKKDIAAIITHLAKDRF